MQIIPALGLTWSNTVNTRLLLQRRDNSDTGHVTRTLDVVLAPHLPNLSVEFAVSESGVAGIQ